MDLQSGIALLVNGKPSYAVILASNTMVHLAISPSYVIAELNAKIAATTNALKTQKAKALQHEIHRLATLGRIARLQHRIDHMHVLPGFATSSIPYCENRVPINVMVTQYCNHIFKRSGIDEKSEVFKSDIDSVLFYFLMQTHAYSN